MKNEWYIRFFSFFFSPFLSRNFSFFFFLAYSSFCYPLSLSSIYVNVFIQFLLVFFFNKICYVYPYNIFPRLLFISIPFPFSFLIFSFFFLLFVVCRYCCRRNAVVVVVVVAGNVKRKNYFNIYFHSR